MAFCDLRPVKIYNEGAGVTYIIGEVFAVYANAPQPLIYSWDLVQKVTEDKRAITIHTETAISLSPRRISATSRITSAPSR